MKIHVGRARLRALEVAGLAALLVASAVTDVIAAEKTLHAFQGGSDGANPYGGLIAGGGGKLYGTTEGGGTGTGCYDPGCGTLFSVDADGAEAVLHSFLGGSDGISPSGSLLMDSSGVLYGTTLGGGGTGCAGYGCGTVFSLTPDGTEKVLYAFQGENDGQYPQGNLIADKDGNLYGMTSEGGDYNVKNCGSVGCGTVFEVTPGGNETTLHEFQGGSNDGANPGGGGVIADGSGNLYGLTSSGGSCSDDQAGCGTVFKLAPDGTVAVLYAFQGTGNGSGDGSSPIGNLIADGSGNFYGTTSSGGSAGKCGCGTVFKLAPNGTETVLYSFKGGTDGSEPEAGVVMDAAGNLYGTTFSGGGTGCKKVHGCGTVFKLAPDGQETVLYAFIPSHGENPAAPLLLSKHEELDGTATAGGKPKDGAVFEVKK